jgi:predicted Zn-dependent peptidase
MNISKYIAAAGLLIAGTSYGQLDRSIVPTAQPAKEIKIGQPDVFTLSNGLTVLIVENNKIPKISFQLSSDIGAMAEGDKAGSTMIAGDLMGSGTTNRTKDVLDEEIDFMGADLSTWSSGIYVSGTKKHMEKCAEIMADVLLNPAFPQSELDRLKEQSISALASSKTNPGAISTNVSGAVNYGLDHPYGEIMTEKTVENIEMNDIKSYYTRAFQPQISYLVIVGDAKASEIKPIVEKYFGKWAKGNSTKNTFPKVHMPHGNHVTFSPQEGSVQSSINVTFPVDLKPNDEDVLAATVMNQILGGGGFGARMMQNLREDKAYTYGCYSSLRSDELIGSFSTTGSFRTEVTDSALVEILSEISKMTQKEVEDEEFNLIKASMAGKFAMSLENPRTIARFAVNTLKYNLPKDHYATYLKRLEAITKADVLRTAKKYLRPEAANIVVVGNESIYAKLNKFDHHGHASKLDFYGNPINEMKPMPAGITADVVMKNYVKAQLQLTDEKAILKRIKKMKSLKQIAKGSVQGMELKIVTYTDKKGNEAMEILAGGQVMQKQYFNGKEGGSSSMQGSTVMTPEEIAEKQKTIGFMQEWFYAEKGIEMKAIGIVDIEGKPCYRIEMSEGKVHYFEVATGYKIKTTTTTVAEGKEHSVSIDFKDYKEYDGIMFPSKIIQDLGMMKLPITVEKIEMNGKIDKAVYSK